MITELYCVVDKKDGYIATVTSNKYIAMNAMIWEPDCYIRIYDAETGIDIGIIDERFIRGQYYHMRVVWAIEEHNKKTR